jgi:hypothetical protein
LKYVEIAGARLMPHVWQGLPTSLSICLGTITLDEGTCVVPHDTSLIASALSVALPDVNKIGYSAILNPLLNMKSFTLHWEKKV